MTVVMRNGLRVDVARAEAKRREAARRWVDKKRDRARGEKPQPRGSKKSSNDWPAPVRKLAAKRSGGVCEFDGCRQRAVDLHHRKARRHRDHRVQNALHLCRVHHLYGVHGDRSRALERGQIVRSGADPAEVPVLLGGRMVLLAADGGWEVVSGG